MFAIVERPRQDDAGRLRYGVVTDERFEMFRTPPGRLGKKPAYQIAGVTGRSGELTRKPLRTGDFEYGLNNRTSDTFAFRPHDVVSRTFYAEGRHTTWQVEFLFQEDPRAICLEDGKIFVREDLAGSPEYLETLSALARARAVVSLARVPWIAPDKKEQIPGLNFPDIPQDNGYGVLRLEPPI